MLTMATTRSTTSVECKLYADKLSRTSATNGKNSNSSNETVIARLDAPGGDSPVSTTSCEMLAKVNCGPVTESRGKGSTNDSCERAASVSPVKPKTRGDALADCEPAVPADMVAPKNKHKSSKSIKNLIHLASQHLTRASHNQQHLMERARGDPPNRSVAGETEPRTRGAPSGPALGVGHSNGPRGFSLTQNNDTHAPGLSKASEEHKLNQKGGSHVLAWTQRYFNITNWSWRGHDHQQPGCKSAPNTPLRSRHAKSGSASVASVEKCPDDGRPVASGRLANGCTQTEPLDQLLDRLNELKNRQGDARGRRKASDQRAVNSRCGDAPASDNSTGNQQPSKPTVRFVESESADKDGDSANWGDAPGGQQRPPRRRHPNWCKLPRQSREQVRFADCGVQTLTDADDVDENDELGKGCDDELPASDDELDPDESARRFVARLFQLPTGSEGTGGGAGACADLLKQTGETPMDSAKFRDYGYKLIDYISNYLDTIGRRRVTPINIEPGYLKSLIKPSAPEQGESFAAIMQDFESHIMCGITHWQHPHFHAYFPAGNAYPSILADMLSDALGCVGFSWAASPAYTELEIIMLDWMGKMIGLPDEFLCLSSSRSSSQTPGIGDGERPAASSSRGGGVIQGSASECVLVNLLAARHWAMEKLRRKYPGTPDGLLLSRLIGYCSKEAHSCVEKASMIGFIRMRALETDERNSLRGDVLARAIEADKAQGLEPFIVCATLGTTSCVSFDNLDELGRVCRDNDDLWLHVDAAYAGSALICPEFKYLMRGIEMATSFNMNPNKWMLINFDCSLMWVKDRFKLTRAFVVDPLYLQHSFSDQAIDYRHWGIPLSRRFRALKLWFVIRNYGVEGLRAYIRNHVRLAKLFESLIADDKRFVVTNEVVLGLVCFRLIGSNALNQRLLSMINASGKLHMVPASVQGRYVIRFCVCDQNAKEADIRYAYRCISQTATELFQLIRAGRERIRTISQQSTIDVSSISLHTQQSLSADRLDNSANVADCPQPAAGDTCNATGEHQAADAAGQRNLQSPTQVKSPLARQRPNSQQTEGDPADQDDLDQEIQIDSLATIDGRDYDLCLDEVAEVDDADADDLGDEFDDEVGDDEDGGGVEVAAAAALASAVGRPANTREEPLPGGLELKPSNTSQHQPSRDLQSMSPMQRANYEARHGRLSRNGRASQTFAADGDEQEEAADEVLKLAEKRNRMSLRYKRKFFVRVVSDPRVYRASISGDINAHASTSSLGNSSTGLHQVPATSGAQSQPPPPEPIGGQPIGDSAAN